ITTHAKNITGALIYIYIVLLHLQDPVAALYGVHLSALCTSSACAISTNTPPYPPSGLPAGSKLHCIEGACSCRR
ncbi:hypothetical protein C8R44DRAFT_762467, partial [Mycena epipterygia]